MSRKVILALATAATIAAASLGSTAADARGFGGGGGFGGGHFAGGGGGLRAAGVVAATSVAAEPRSQPSAVPATAACRFIQFSRRGTPAFLGIPAGGGTTTTGTGSSVTAAGSSSMTWASPMRRPGCSRPLHLPDQDLHAGWPRGVRGRLHQRSGQRPGRRRPRCRRHPGDPGAKCADPAGGRKDLRRDAGADLAELCGPHLSGLSGSEPADGAGSSEELKMSAKRMSLRLGLKIRPPARISRAALFARIAGRQKHRPGVGRQSGHGSGGCAGFAWSHRGTA